MRTSCSIALALALAANAAIGGAQTAPLPADPLTPGERSRAVEIATPYAQKRNLLPAAADRFALVGVEVLTMKPADGERPSTPESAGRHASALFFDYERNAGLRVLVDLGAGEAREAVAVQPRSVPIGRAEVEAAVQLALADAAVERLVGAPAESYALGPAAEGRENTVEALRAVGAADDDPCTRNRCVDLLFRRGGQYVVGSRVTVDLTSRAVRVVAPDRSR